MIFPSADFEFTRLIPWSERRRRNLPADHPGTETVRAEITLEIDETAIMRELGSRAIGNKSRKASEIGGLVKATATIL